MTPTGDQPAPPSAPRRGSGPFERFTVNLTAQSSRALQDAVGLTGHTKTDTVNKALQLWHHIQHLAGTGGAVYFRAADGGDLERVRFL